MAPDLRRDSVWMPAYRVRDRLLKSGMTEKDIYGQALFTAKYFLEKIRGPGGWVLSDFCLLLAYHME